MTLEGITRQEMRRGCWDPVERLKDMDLNHVEASLCFPTFPRFCGQTFAEAHDKEVALAVAEIRRNAARGVKAVTFSEIPAHLGLPSIHSGHWDPFFAVCEETGTVVNMHIGSSSQMPAASRTPRPPYRPHSPSTTRWRR